MNDDLQQAIDAYIENNWDDVVADIASLVEVESVENLDAAASGAPYGPGPRAALDCALAMAQRFGLDAHDCEGHIGYADLPGKSATQIGIIGHTDVVPAGPGWHFEPFAVTRKDGYLLGRGVIDDKGPLVTALHAVKFWHDRSETLPYTIRVLFGANEETNMKDVAYYRAHYEDPAFLFTPDAEFPVCYGEAGICNGTLESAPIESGFLKELRGGVAVNAVPGEAYAVVACADTCVGGQPACNGTCVGGQSECDAAQAAIQSEPPQGAMPKANGLVGSEFPQGITIEANGSTITVHAQGKSAHASTPEKGVNAISLLVQYLLSTDYLTPNERQFLQLVQRVTSCYDGSTLRVQAHDEHFGDLTAVGGTIALAEGRMRLSIDFRYPTTITSAQIEQAVNSVAKEYGAHFTMEHDKEPFLMDPESPTVQAMLSAYNEATGEQAQPFTMKGGTYARVFTTGVSFGPDKPWEPKPDWVGSMHGPDEGVREDLLKQAFAIYVRTIGKLMELDL